MTARDAIRQAMQLLSILAGNTDPGPDDSTDYLRELSRMKRAMFGTFIGPRLAPQAASGTAIQAETGGLYFTAAGVATTLTLPANPRAGARVGVADAANSLAAFPWTVAGNGRLIEGATSLTLNANGTARQWWYRADTATWTREADYASLDDAIEFPDALAAYIPYMLAIVIAPSGNANIPPAVSAGAMEGREAFARAYARRAPAQMDPPIGVAAMQTPQAGS